MLEGNCLKSEYREGRDVIILNNIALFTTTPEITILDYVNEI